LQQAFAEYDVACDNLPEEWWWVDDGVPALFDKALVRSLLADFSDNNFWKIAK